MDRITLTAADGYVLSRVDGATTGRMIIEITPLPIEDVGRSLLGLLCTGVVEYKQRPAKRAPAQSRSVADPVGPELSPPERPEDPQSAPSAAAPPSRPATQQPARPCQPSADFRRAVEQIHEGLGKRDHFQVLGLLRSANDVEIKGAYTGLVKRFHPDLHRGADPELAAKIQRVFARMTEAYRILTSPEGGPQAAKASPTRATRSETGAPAQMPRVAAAASRAPADPASLPPSAPASTPAHVEGPRRPTTASEALAAAEAHASDGRPWAVAPTLEPFLSEMDGAVERRARLLLARVYLMNPDSARRAEAEYLRLIQLDAADHESYLALGRFYRERGLPARARGMFDKVLRLQPGHKAALAELASLGSTATAELSQPVGLLGKLTRN
jgi:hypothetical protein